MTQGMLQVAEKVAAQALREQQHQERIQQREAERLQRQKAREEERQAREMEREAKPPSRRKVCRVFGIWAVLN